MGTSAVFGSAVFGQAIFGDSGGLIIKARVNTSLTLSGFKPLAESLADTKYIRSFAFRERGTSKHKIITVRGQ